MAKRRKKKDKTAESDERRAESTKRTSEWPDHIWAGIDAMKRQRGEPEGLRDRSLCGLTRASDVQHPNWNGGDR